MLRCLVKEVIFGSMSVIKTIIEKMKLKEICAVLFIAGIIITYMPQDYAMKFSIVEFRETYQTYISVGLIIIAAFYIFSFITWVSEKIFFKFHNPEKIGKNYLKNVMSADEMGFLVEKLYDRESNVFRNTAYIDMSDGRGAGLTSKHVIYLSTNISNWNSFAYNLQPWAYKFLNKNLKEGNIVVSGSSVQFQLK